MPALPLLQTRYQFMATPDKRAALIFLAALVGFIGLIVIGGLLARRRNRHLDPKVRQRMGRRAFARTARSIGLQQHHIQTLEHLIRVAKVGRPFLIFTSPSLLDELLRKGIYALHQSTGLSEEDREHRLTTLFQIKQIVERNAGSGKAIRSTISIRVGQSVSISTPDGVAATLFSPIFISFGIPMIIATQPIWRRHESI